MRESQEQNRAVDGSREVVTGLSCGKTPRVPFGRLSEPVKRVHGERVTRGDLERVRT
jgi:hypothetical protein